MANGKPSKTIAKRTGRPRPLPPDVTARNLAIEKQRRGELNDKLLDMARLLPALTSARRLSKRLISTEGARHLQQQRTMNINAARDIQNVMAENQRLVSELNLLRLQMSGGVAITTEEPQPATEAIIQLMNVKHEQLGQFPAGFGDNLGSRETANNDIEKEAAFDAENPAPQPDTNLAYPTSEQDVPPDAAWHEQEGQLKDDSWNGLWDLSDVYNQTPHPTDINFSFNEPANPTFHFEDTTHGYDRMFSRNDLTETSFASNVFLDATVVQRQGDKTFASIRK